MELKDVIDATPDADGCYLSPIIGERVQPWRRWERDEKGVIHMLFTKGRDPVPVGSVLILLDMQDNVVGGCMADTFRKHAQHDGYGNFRFGPCLLPNAICKLFEVCSKPRCFQEATITDNGRPYCSVHGLEVVHG